MSVPPPDPGPEENLSGASRSPRRWVLGALLALVVGSALAVFWLYGRSPGGDSNEAVIAVVYTGSEEDPFMQGVRMAVEDVNRGGGTLGRTVVLDAVREEDFTDKTNLESVVSRSLQMAAQIGSDDSVVAVVGHGASSTAIPASALYNLRHKPFMSTHATATSLTNHDFDYVFALQPSNYANTSMMANYALQQGLRRFVVLSDRADYGREVTKMFSTFVTQGGGTILYQGTLDPELQSIDKLLLFLMDNDVFSIHEADAVFVVSSSNDDSAQFIRRSREFGLATPILGADNLYSSLIERQVGAANMRNVWAVSIYDGDSDGGPSGRFRTRFEALYGEEPDLPAAVGYDAITLFDHVAEKAGSFDGNVIADKLRVMRIEGPFQGVTGTISFTASGMLADTQAYIVRHDGAHFHTVARYKQPITWGGEALPEEPGELLPPRSTED